MSGEIVTLQFGNYSNYIGAHYWNLQESQFAYSSDNGVKPIPDVNHDILFREGVDIRNKPTFTPRMLLFDLKENINVFRRADREIQTSSANWNGELQVYESDKMPKSSFQTDLSQIEKELLEREKDPSKKVESNLKPVYNMDEDVKYWSDYVKLNYHDRSYMLVNDCQGGFKDSEPFDIFNHGLNVYNDEDYSSKFEDNLRHFAEECDHLQGFQYLVDPYNGFGGLASKTLTYVNEEFPKRSIVSFLSFPYYDDQAHDKNMTKLINTSLTFKSFLSDHDNMTLVPISLFDSFYLAKHLNPITLRGVSYKPSLNYHSSAILAALIDSVTSPWRQKSQSCSLNEMNGLFDVYKYQIATLQAIFPFDLDPSTYLFNYLQEKELHKSSTCFTPLCSDFFQSIDSCDSLSGAYSVFCRGVDDERVKNKRDDYYLKGTVSADKLLERYYMDMYPKSRGRCFSTKLKLKLDMTYPNIFVNQRKEVGLISILQCSRNISGLLKHMKSQMAKVNLGKQTKYLENGMEMEDFVELSQFNNELCDLYSV